MSNMKFRVWDVLSRRWFTDSHFISPDGQLYQHTVPGDMLLLDPEYYIVMLSTGIKDANGVEIYEGDVIKYGLSEHNSMTGYVSITTILSVNVINHDNKYPPVVAMVSDKDSYASYNWAIPSNYKVTIIGNVYENPDLLRGEK